ncbi:hypothetical protein LSAT2_017873 [Lamellibrachia satsuma]|nr:hypothetical protein LSAT2_017873 [Lamellibrachia satsuma]
MNQATRLAQWLWLWIPRAPYRSICGLAGESTLHSVRPTRQRAPDVEALLASYGVDGFPFENIAFEGGGVKGIAHTGAVRVGCTCILCQCQH